VSKRRHPAKVRHARRERAKARRRQGIVIRDGRELQYQSILLTPEMLEASAVAFQETMPVQFRHFIKRNDTPVLK